jgi:hypothetical protein
MSLLAVESMHLSSSHQHDRKPFVERRVEIFPRLVNRLRDPIQSSKFTLYKTPSMARKRRSTPSTFTWHFWAIALLVLVSGTFLMIAVIMVMNR